MPAAGDPRPLQRRRRAPPERPPHRRPAPPLLPRLLPAGLRRLHPSGQRRAQPSPQRGPPAGGAEPHRGHPRQGPRPVRRHRLVRRHHRAGHPRRREPRRRPRLLRVPGPPRQPGAGLRQRRVQAAPADGHRGRAPVRLQRRGADGPGRPGLALRRAHRGEGAVQRVRRHLDPRQRRRDEVRDGGVLGGGQRRPAAGPGLSDADRVRQPLLHRAGAEEEQGGDAAVGPGAGDGPAHELARPGIRRQPLVVLRPVQDLHDQDEQPQGTTGERRRGQAQLLQAQLQRCCRRRGGGHRRRCLIRRRSSSYTLLGTRPVPVVRDSVIRSIRRAILAIYVSINNNEWVPLRAPS